MVFIFLSTHAYINASFHINHCSFLPIAFVLPALVPMEIGLSTKLLQ
jgi:hypothetical protein